MGGEGYALERALSDTSLAQLKSKEKRARSDFPRRSPSGVYEWSWCTVKDCMDKSGSQRAASVCQCDSRFADVPLPRFRRQAYMKRRELVPLLICML